MSAGRDGDGGHGDFSGFSPRATKCHTSTPPVPSRPLSQLTSIMERRLPYEAKLGEIALFENEKMGNDRAPDHTGYVVAHRDIKEG